MNLQQKVSALTFVSLANEDNRQIQTGGGQVGGINDISPAVFTLMHSL